MSFLFFGKKKSLSSDFKKKRNQERLMLVLSGILMGVSFPPFPFPFQLLMFTGLIPLFIVIEKREKLIDINRAVYLFGFVFSLITLYWVGSWQKESDPFLMISGVLLVFVNPVFFMIPSTLLYFSRNIFNRSVSLCLLPFFWITYEYLYMLTDLSFPWLILGGGLSKFINYIQIADIIGTLGLSLLVVLINVLLYKALISYKVSGRKLLWNGGAALLLILIPLIYGNLILSGYKLSQRTVTAGIIQPNINPWDKWTGGNLDDLAELNLELSQQAINEGAEILFWPETALPVYLFGGAFPSTANRIVNFITERNIFLLTGMPHVRFYDKSEVIPGDAKYSEKSEYYYQTYNAVLLIAPAQGVVQHYGKMKLVPFGERVPFADELPFLKDLIKWGVGISGWNVGKDTTIFKAVINNDDTIRINGLVCYESIYPYFISGFTRKNTDLIAIVTNDSWYGNSSGPYQHKEFAVLRAVENRKSVIRCANGGISTIIDPLGRTVKETEMFTRTVLTGKVVLQEGKTFFTENSLLLPLPASAFSLFVAGIFFFKKLKVLLKI